MKSNRDGLGYQMNSARFDEVFAFNIIISYNLFVIEKKQRILVNECHFNELNKSKVIYLNISSCLIS